MMNRFREPVNGFTHLTGAVLGGIGLIVLIVLTYDDPTKLIPGLIYGISVILLYAASTTYHLVKSTQSMQDWLRSLDHAAIYLLIAGTYTPFCFNLLTGNWRWGMLGAIWALALVGIVYKIVFRRRQHRWPSTALYVGMGWLAVLALPQIIHTLAPTVLALIVAGGLAYTLGAVVYALRRPNFHRHFGHHELWHLFVLAGSALHYIAVVAVLTRQTVQ
ncbi:MAG: hemolysin III family protein [Anaerolineae bacterium]